MCQVSKWMDHNMNGIAMNRTTVVEQPLLLEVLNQRMTQNSIDFLRWLCAPEVPVALIVDALRDKIV